MHPCCHNYVKELKYFPLTRGTDTDWNGHNYLTININSQIDLTGCTLEFKLGAFDRSFTDLSEPLVINMDADDFTCLPVGENFGEIKVYDANRKVMTWNNQIPFFVKTAVSGDIELDEYSMTFNILDGGQNIIEINVKTPQDKKIVSGSITVPEIAQGSLVGVSVVFSDTLESDQYQAVVTNTGANFGWANLRWAVSDKASAGFTLNVMNEGTGTSSETIFDYIVVA